MSRLPTIVLFSILSLFLSSCFTTTLFPDFWDTDGSRAFDRTESPYVDSPDAVILFDLEKLHIDRQEWDLIAERHVRIQIFTEAGKENGNVRIPYWHSDKITEIKAQTILPNGQRIPLDPKEIFDDGEEKRWRYKVFALPGVEDQCIIEYQYKYRDNSIGIFPPKYFQSYLYTEYSKMVLTLTEGFAYHATTMNPPRGFEDPEGVLVNLPQGRTEKKYTWELYDIPPIRDEAYMYNREDHLFSIQMQMVSYVDPYNNYTFVKKWTDIIDLLMEDYGSYLKNSGALKKLLAEIEPADSSGTLQPRDIYTFVRDGISGRRYSGLRAKDMWNTIHDRSGSRIEKNLLAMALMRQAGFEVEAILISRRSNGKINISAPTINDFNHLILKLQEGSTSTLLDPSARFYTYGMMPSDNYSGIGLVLKKGKKEQFIRFSSTPPLSREDILTTCTLHEDGSLSGNINFRKSGYHAINFRADHSEAEDDIAFAYDNLVKHFTGIVIDSVQYEINSDDHSKPIQATLYFQVPEYVTPTADRIYLPSTVYKKFTTNKLTSEKRDHPVEFSYPNYIKETVNIILPKGYEVIEMPTNLSIRGPGLGFQKLAKSFEGSLQMSWSYQLSKLVHQPGVYAELKNFYTEAVAADQAVIVLEKRH